VRKVAAWLTLSFLVSFFVKPFAPAAVTEPATAVSFPEQLPKDFSKALQDAPTGGKPSLQRDLVATGVRKKWRSIKVYAVGLYLDTTDSLWGRSRTSKELLARGAGRVSIRIVIASSLVTQRKLADALREAILPQMSTDDAATKALDEFEQMFADGPKLKAGSVILLDLGEKGVKVGIEGKSYGEVRHPALGHALLETYVGKDAVAPQFRDSVLSGMAEKRD